MMNAEFLLGIFTGNHAGAEVCLEPGEYVIGSAAECDVALTDSSLSTRHCSLTLDASCSARLHALEGVLLFQGAPLSDALDWPVRTPVLAGLVCLAWTHPNEGWGDMRIPSLLASTEPSEDEDSPTESSPGNEPLLSVPSPSLADETPEIPLPSSAKKLRRPLLAGVAALLLLSLCVGVRSFSDTPNTKTAALEQALTASGFPALRVEENGGRLAVYGLADTEEAIGKIRSIAARQPSPVQVIVRGREEFIRAVQDALASHGLFPQVRVERGHATLVGYVQDALVESAAIAWARGATPPVADIRSALLTRPLVEKVLTEELTRAGLTEKVATDWRPGVIALSCAATDADALSAVITQTRSRLDSPLSFQVSVLPENEKIHGNTPLFSGTAPSTRAGQGPFGDAFSLRGVSPQRTNTDLLPFITTSDGSVYFIGGTLPGGYVLTGIYSDRLEFSKNGSTFAYKLQGH